MDRSWRRSFAGAAWAFVLLIMGGCAVQQPAGRDQSSGDGGSEQALYAQASQALVKEQYAIAKAQFSALVARHPATPHRREALLGMAYAGLQLGDASAAEQLTSRVIAEGAPGDYAYYLRASARLRSHTDAPDVALRAANEDLNILLQRYPNGRYVTSAKTLRTEIQARLAAFELRAARHHLDAQEYVGAVNRSRYLIETYPDSPEATTALAIMAEAYRRLGLNELAAGIETAQPGRAAMVNSPD